MSEIREKPLKGRAFSWEEKAAKRLLRKRMNGDSTAVYVLSVYCALCEIASDENSARFTTSHPHIAEMAGCRLTSLKMALNEIKEAGLILIETPPLRGPSTFTLLFVGRNTTNEDCNTASVSRNGVKPPATTVEEYEKNQPEETQKNPRSPLAGDMDGVPENLKGEDFKEAWAKWKRHRKEKRKPLTPTNKEEELRYLSRLGPDRAIAIINFTIRKGWQGLAEDEEVPLAIASATKTTIPFPTPGREGKLKAGQTW